MTTEIPAADRATNSDVVFAGALAALVAAADVIDPQ
jgi:hypothetical protein